MEDGSDEASYSGEGDSTPPIRRAPPVPSTPQTLSREKNRLTLRSYLHSLLDHSVIANSAILKAFLLEDEIVLSRGDEEDVVRREGMDRARVENEKRFRDEAERRAGGIEGGLRGFKDDLVRSGECFNSIHLSEES